MRQGLSAMKNIPFLLLLLAVVACGPPPNEFVPSTRSAVELRGIQTRVIQGDPLTVQRDVAGALQDRGYRILRADTDTGVISAVRGTVLQVVFVVQGRNPGESVVRANATVRAFGREGQVDSPAFYDAGLFRPLAEFMQREVTALPEGANAPDAIRPTVETNTVAQRQAAAQAQAAQPTTQAPAPPQATPSQPAPAAR